MNPTDLLDGVAQSLSACTGPGQEAGTFQQPPRRLPDLSSPQLAPTPISCQQWLGGEEGGTEHPVPQLPLLGSWVEPGQAHKVGGGPFSIPAPATGMAVSGVVKMLVGPWGWGKGSLPCLVGPAGLPHKIPAGVAWGACEQGVLPSPTYPSLPFPSVQGGDGLLCHSPRGGAGLVLAN